MHIRVALAIVVTFIKATLVAAMVAAAVYKIWTDGVLEYVQHYTNWSWTLQILYYLGTLPGPLVVALELDGWPLRLVSRFNALFFVPLWGILSSVLIMVAVMLLTGAEFLEHFALVIPLPFLVLGNEIFHFLVLLFFIADTIVDYRIKYWSLNDLFAEPAVHRNPALYWALVAYETVLASLTTMLWYLVFFDPQQVYSSTLNLLVGGVVVLATLGLSTLPLYLFLFFFDLGSAPLGARWLRESEFASPRDRVVMAYARKVY